MRAKSVNFERGKDPKDAMGIGDQEKRDIQKSTKEMIKKKLLKYLKKSLLNCKE